MLSGFEHVQKINRLIPPDYLRVQGHTLRISAETFQQFGEPRKVEFFFNEATKQILLRKAPKYSETAYAFRERTMSIKSLRRRIKFPEGNYRCIIQDGALIATYEGN